MEHGRLSNQPPTYRGEPLRLCQCPLVLRNRRGGLLHRHPIAGNLGRAANASKYGALSVPEGKIVLHWKFYEGTPGPECFRLIWRERSGPTVKPPKRIGFGSFVLEQMMKRGKDTNVKIDFAPDGVIWTLDMPASYAVRVE